VFVCVCVCVWLWCSAVDQHVGNALFTNLIRGKLRNKLVIFVTNQIQYLSQCDKILVLNRGILSVIPLLVLFRSTQIQSWLQRSQFSFIYILFILCIVEGIWNLSKVDWFLWRIQTNDKWTFEWLPSFASTATSTNRTHINPFTQSNWVSVKFFQKKSAVKTFTHSKSKFVVV
jgi:hypothetical protein